MDDIFLFYMVDVDMCDGDCEVLETVTSDLFRTKSLDEAIKFSKKYAKEKGNFDFQYLRDNGGKYYEMTIRKYYKEETNEENGEWDDWLAIRVSKPRKR